MVEDDGDLLARNKNTTAVSAFLEFNAGDLPLN